MAPPDDRPTRAEAIAAYAAATLATLVWAASVLPGVHLADPALDDDLAAPMLRGPLLILPALLLLVAGPVTTVITHGPAGLRALLAAGDAFVSLFAAAALAGTRTGDPARWGFAGVLALMGLLAVRETVLALSASQPEGAHGDESPSTGDAPLRRGADLRLALAILALLAPPSFLAKAGVERASLLAPFGYVAVSAFGARFSRTAPGLRLTASLLFALLSLHLLVTLRLVMREDGTDVRRWTWCGWATIALASALLAATASRVLVLFRDRRRRRAAEASGPAGPAGPVDPAAA